MFACVCMMLKRVVASSVPCNSIHHERPCCLDAAVAQNLRIYVGINHPSRRFLAHGRDALRLVRRASHYAQTLLQKLQQILVSGTLFNSLSFVRMESCCFVVPFFFSSPIFTSDSLTYLFSTLTFQTRYKVCVPFLPV